MHNFKGFAYTFALILAAVVLGCSTPKGEPNYAEVPGASMPTTAAETVAEMSPPPQKEAPAPAKAEPVEPVKAAPAEAPASKEEKPELIVTPDNTLTGTIVSVNDIGRFVVLRFPLGRVPAVDTKLFVYRQGLKVAELKVTGPQRDDHTVADIRSGDCRVNDEVRDR